MFERPVPVVAQNQSAACTAAPVAIDEGSVAVSFPDRLNASIAWDQPPGAGCAGFTYQIAVMSSPDPARTFQHTAATPPFTVSWTDFQPHWISLRATNPLGSGPPTTVLGPFQRFPCTAPPTIPADVVAAGPATIEWSPVTVSNCAVSYIVGIGANPDQPLSIYWTTPTSATQQTLTLPPAPHPWYARVHAITQMGWSGPSIPVAFSSPLPAATPAPYPPAPTNVQVSLNGRTLTVTWELTEQVEAIWLVALSSESGTGKVGEIVVPAATSFTYTFDQPITFWLRVSAMRGPWIGAPSARVRVDVP